MIYNFLSRRYNVDMNNFPWKTLIKPGLALLLIVIGCAVTARFLAGQETLAEYAARNPEAAYGTEEESDDVIVRPEEENIEGEQKTDAGDDDAASDATGIDQEKNVQGAERTIERNTSADSATTAATNNNGNAGSGSSDSRSSSNAGTGSSAESAASASSSDSTGASNGSDHSGSDGATDASSANSGDTSDNASTGASVERSEFTDDSDVYHDRVTVQEGFFYEPIPDAIKKRITGVSYPEDCPIGLDLLRYLNVRYIDFYGDTRNGELICNEKIAKDLTEIFYDLYDHRYPIESIRLIDDFGGDDDASMIANNTSCFNYRTVAGSNNLSRHALGLAIDINPLYNPWINYKGDGTYTVSPPEAAEYADRSRDFAHKITSDDLCCQFFRDHGFFWGGNWNNPDYQHFQYN